MSSMYQALPEEVLAWYEQNEDELRSQYEEEIDADNDSYESKEYRLNSDDCFFEWVWDLYDKKHPAPKTPNP